MKEDVGEQGQNGCFRRSRTITQIQTETLQIMEDQEITLIQEISDKSGQGEHKESGNSDSNSDAEQDNMDTNQDLFQYSLGQED